MIILSYCPIKTQIKKILIDPKIKVYNIKKNKPIILVSTKQK